MENQFGLTDRVLSDIRELAKRHDVRRVILFGSRARGDYRKTSDIDLAIEGGNSVRFSLDVEDTAWTLLTFDVVALDGAVQPELRKSIEKEGVVLYEKI